MKKLLVGFLSLFLMIGIVNAEEKVKVYMFEAGGCPYCEAQEEYLTGLEGYGKTFELIKKELYVDHVEWKQGKDYALGKKVAELFNEAGFEDASYEGTPFVVISDLYAAASYSTDLETFINAAYEEGDKDVISCVQAGKTDCIRPNKVDFNTDSKAVNSKAGIVLAIVGGVVLIAAIIYVAKHRTTDLEEQAEVIEEEVHEEIISETPTETVKKVTRTVRTKKTNKK